MRDDLKLKPKDWSAFGTWLYRRCIGKSAEELARMPNTEALYREWCKERPS